MTLAWVCVIISFVMLFMGSPLFLAFGLTMSVAAVWALGLPLNSLLGGQVWSNIDSFTLLAAPLYVLAGNLMSKGELARALVDLVNSFIGHVKGGLGMVTIVVAAIFAAMSGSILAAAATLALLMGKMMEDSGYAKPTAAAIICAGAILGPIIPPSIWMIIYAGMSETSVAALFAGGFVPGIMLAIFYIIVVRIMAMRAKTPVTKPATWPMRGRAFVKAVPALFAPVIVLGGIYGGVFTPTEAGAVSCVYAALVGYFVYRGLNRKNVLETLGDTARVTGNITLLVTAAIMLGFVLSQLGLPTMIINAVKAVHLSAPGFLALMFVLMVVLGMFLEAICILVIVVPVFLPVVLSLGISPVHFGLIMTVGLGLGQLTPPVGIVTFMVSSLTDQPSWPVFRAGTGMIVATVLGFLLVCMVPEITLWLPRALGLIR